MTLLSEGTALGTFTLSIDPVGGKAFQHGFRRETIDAIARACVEQEFNDRRAAALPARTITLIRDGKIVAAFLNDKWIYGVLDIADSAPAEVHYIITRIEQ